MGGGIAHNRARYPTLPRKGARRGWGTRMHYWGLALTLSRKR